MRINIAVFITFIALCLACNPDNPEPEPPAQTDNNTRETAWKINLPYSLDTTVAADDEAEVFFFGIGPGDAFGSLITIELVLVEPGTGSFHLSTRLESEDGVLLVQSADDDIEPSAWVASRRSQNYYLTLNPTGSSGDDGYRYTINISASSLNDPYEPDDDTLNSSPVIFGIETEPAYLCSPFSDSTITDNMRSLSDYYKLELASDSILFIYLRRMEKDGQPVMKLYKPGGELYRELNDSSAVLDLGADFVPGSWYLEITDGTGAYPQYGSGNVAGNYVSSYYLFIDNEPE